MRTEHLMSYEADKGSCVINGVAISNGIGDGCYDIWFSDIVPENYRLIEDIWFDLRECNLKIWHYDCNGGKDYDEFTKEMLMCEAVQFAVGVGEESGNICIVKYF